MRKYRLTQQARTDLQGIVEYISAQSRAAARRVARALEDSFRFLAEHPHAGTRRDDLAMGVRLFSPKKPADQYVVFFQPMRSGVQILSVIHGARDYEGMFAREER